MFDRLTDPQRRALRTLLQAILGALGAGLIDVMVGGDMPNEWLPIITVLLTTIVTAVQNSLEESDLDNLVVNTMRRTK